MRVLPEIRQRNPVTPHCVDKVNDRCTEEELPMESKNSYLRFGVMIATSTDAPNDDATLYATIRVPLVDAR